MSRTFRIRLTPHRQPRTKRSRVVEHYATLELVSEEKATRKLVRMRTRGELRSAAVSHPDDDLNVNSNKRVIKRKRRFLRRFNRRDLREGVSSNETEKAEDSQS